MPTLDEVVGRVAGLEYVARFDSAPRPVMGVWSTGRGDVPRRWENGREIAGWRGMLAVVTGTPGRVPYGALARGGAAGLVARAPVPDELLSAGRHYRLPVVAATSEAAPVEYLAQVVAGLRDAETTRQARAVRRLLDSATSRDGDRQIKQWLADALGADVLLISPYQVGPPMLPTGRVVPADPIAALAGADLLEAKDLTLPGEDDGDDILVRLTGLDTGVPRHVLAVARRGEWPPTTREAMSLAGQALASWLRQTSVGDAERVPIRTAAQQLLLDGQVSWARQAAAPLRGRGSVDRRHDVLTASQVRVCIISVTTQRDAVMAALHHYLGSGGLVAPSLTRSQHIVVVIAADDRIVARLRDYLRPYAWAYAGVSGPWPLDQAGMAYRDARQALAGATDRADRWAVYESVPDLASVLPNGPAHRWQQDLLEPLMASPSPSEAARDRWLETTHLVLAYGTTAAAEITGTYPNTARRRAVAVASALGLDLADLGDSTVLDLALRIRRRRLREPARSRPITLGELLASPAADDWARNLLGRLHPPASPDLLATWLDTQLDGTEATARAAERLGIATKTLVARLHQAEDQLGRTLITTSAERGEQNQTAVGDQDQTGQPERGVHDLVLAAHITKLLPRPILTPRHTDR